MKKFQFKNHSHCVIMKNMSCEVALNFENTIQNESDVTNFRMCEHHKNNYFKPLIICERILQNIDARYRAFLIYQNVVNEHRLVHEEAPITR